MLQITGDKKEIYVLKSADKTGEIALYKPFYEAWGKRVEIFEAEDVERNIDRWKKGFVISALNQKDLLSFSDGTTEAMIEAGMYNDFRTIFLIHDKRFMNLWFQDAFTDRCLTGEEAAFLRSHAIPTYLYGDRDDIWQEARRNKDVRRTVDGQKDVGKNVGKRGCTEYGSAALYPAEKISDCLGGDTL